GGEYDGYAPEQRILALRNLENQLAPRHWLFPDSRNGGGELGRRLAAALGERPAGRVWQVEDGRCIGRAGAGREDIQRALPRLLLAAAECAEPVSETRHEARELHMAAQVARNLPR
ncbi:electron transfer flavoprotein subunit alpha/FixB family protein, partial [Pseudomonas aeruginosa]